MAESDPPGGHGRVPPPGKPRRLVSDYFKPAQKDKDDSEEEKRDESEDIDLSLPKRVTRSGRLIAPAQRRAGRRFSSRIPSKAFPSSFRGESSGATPGLAARSSRTTSPGPRTRPPAKRPQATLEISSDSGEYEPEAGPLSRPAKKPKPSSVVPQREQLSKSSFTFGDRLDTYVSSTTAFKTERAEKPARYVYENFDSFNQDRVQQVIQGMRVELSNDLVSPRTSGIQRSVDVLLGLPKKHDFQYAVQSYQKAVSKSAQRTIVHDNDQWSLMARNPTRANVLMIARLSQAEYTIPEANSLCEAFVEILNHWQVKYCRTSVHFVLFHYPTTYAEKRSTRLCGPRVLEHSSPIPELSDRYEFVSIDSYGAVKRSIIKQSPGPGDPPCFQSLLPSEEELPIDQTQRESLQRAERLLRLYSASISKQGGLIDLNASMNMWTNLLEKYGGLFDSGLSWPEEKVLEPEGYGIPASDPQTESKLFRKRIPESTGLSAKALGKMPVRTRSLSSQADSVTEQQPMDDMAQKYSEVMERLRQKGTDPADDLGLKGLLENLKDAKDRGGEQAFLAVLAVLYGELD
ncbi:hypothetical protein FBULB1_9345 [Fusarium bulbicola]|nr:hypothetical protein FBULB1_9345 [Fusarium bulbicola]